MSRLGDGQMVTMKCHGPLDGFRMPVDWSRHRHYLHGSWEPDVVNAMQQCVTRGDSAIDVGAHIGYHSLILARCVGTRGRVVALEPVEANRVLLEANLRLNNCEHVDVMGVAAGSSEGSVTLGTEERHRYPGTSAIGRSATRVATVNTTTIDTIVDAMPRGVKFMKIDVEGAELAVLDGACRTLRTHHPVLVIELHDPDAPDAVLRRLREFGYRVRWRTRTGPIAHVLAT